MYTILHNGDMVNKENLFKLIEKSSCKLSCIEDSNLLPMKLVRAAGGLYFTWLGQKVLPMHLDSAVMKVKAHWPSYDTKMHGSKPFGQVERNKSPLQLGLSGIGHMVQHRSLNLTIGLKRFHTGFPHKTGFILTHIIILTTSELAEVHENTRDHGI